MEPQFIVHESTDTVGVVVVDILNAGEKVSGWVMETDETIIMVAKADIPLGHKLALREINKGDTITKYGQDIGKAIDDISSGEHVHVHNVKTKRW